MKKTLLAFAGALCLAGVHPSIAGESPGTELKAGLAIRDITPDGPVSLNGYAARKHESEKVDQRLQAGAVAFEDAAGGRVVFLTADNCEVTREFMAPVLKTASERFRIPEDAMILVTSHTHSAPCVPGVLAGMFDFKEDERKHVEAYGEKLRAALVDLVGDALADLKPALLSQSKGKAGFAMNRRQFFENRVEIGENPDGPVDRDVPVLRIASPAGETRGILYGYACHATSIAGEEFYWVSGDYIGYAREHLEAAFAGSKTFFFTGCGADANPSPRGRLAHAKQHGLELAGAVCGVLSRPMEPVHGPIRRAFARLDLPLAPSPAREKLTADAQGQDPYVKARALSWLALLDGGKPLPRSVSCPMEVVRLGDDLTFFFLSGEVVVDYALRIKREFAAQHPWVVGYAFETSCYIPSMRVLKEGGYEADSSLIYYGFYGPLLGTTENLILEKFRELAR